MTNTSFMLSHPQNEYDEMPVCLYINKLDEERSNIKPSSIYSIKEQVT